MNRKSSTCTSRRTGRPLTEYDTKAEAKTEARFLKQNFNKHLIPYHCQACGLWHLSPANRQTPSITCPVCIGKNGHSKESYATEETAQQRAAILRKEQKVILSVYPCPAGNGWHLTKRISSSR